jgi:O-antigen/teichoic acid export membrane protein
MVAVAPFLTHGLGPDGRGLVAAATVPFMLLSSAMTFGMPEAVTYVIGRGILEPNLALRAAQTVLLACSLLAAALIWFLAPALSAGSDTVAGLIHASCLVFLPTQMLWAYRGRAQGLHQWRRINVEKALTASVRFAGIAYLFVAARLSVESASLVLILAPSFGLLGYLFSRGAPSAAAVRTDGGLLPGRWPAARYLMSFGGKVWLGSIAGILLSRLDQLLIVPLSGAKQLGFYAVAVNIGDIALFATAAVASVLLASESKNPNNARVAACSSLLFVAVVAITLPLCLTAYWWIPAVFGQDFRPSAAPAMVLLIATAMGCPGSIAGAALTARGQPQSRSRSILVGLVVNVILILVLVPAAGALGAALATLGGLAAMTIVNLAQLKRSFELSALSMYVPTPEVYRLVLRRPY